MLLFYCYLSAKAFWPGESIQIDYMSSTNKYMLEQILWHQTCVIISTQKKLDLKIHTKPSIDDRKY